MAADQVILPVLPQPLGPNPNKARFFMEAAGAFELLALFHSLTQLEQEEFTTLARGLAVTVASRRPK